MDKHTNGDAATRSLKVLLVEDSKIVAERLGEAISSIAGVELIGTLNAEAAAIAVTANEEVDVIILDLHLRQGTGFGVMRSLSNTRRKPKIIVLTNYELPEYKTAALALGATYFLDKARDSGRVPELIAEFQDAHSALH